MESTLVSRHCLLKSRITSAHFELGFVLYAQFSYQCFYTTHTHGKSNQYHPNLKTWKRIYNQPRFKQI